MTTIRNQPEQDRTVYVQVLQSQTTSHIQSIGTLPLSVITTLCTNTTHSRQAL